MPDDEKWAQVLSGTFDRDIKKHLSFSLGLQLKELYELGTSSHHPTSSALERT